MIAKQKKQFAKRMHLEGSLPHCVIALATVAVFSTAVTVSAQDIKLPPTMAVTVHNTGTAGFNIAVTVGKAQQRTIGDIIATSPITISADPQLTRSRD